MNYTVWRRIIGILFAVVAVTTTILFVMVLRYDNELQREGALYSVEVVGQYSEEGGPWQPLTRDVFFQNLTYRDITVRGHFTRDLPAGSKLFLNLDHLRVRLRVNGEDIFALAPVEGDGNLTQAIGRQWVTVASPGILTTDEVELNFGNLYKNAYMIQFDELLWQMYTGDERMMLLEAIRLDGWPLGIGTALLVLTLFLLAIALGCAIMRIKGGCRFLWLGLTTLFASCWFYTLSSAPTFILPFPVTLNVLYAFSMQGIAVFLLLFAADHLAGWRRAVLHGCTGMLLLVMQIALINQFVGIQDLYKAIDVFAIFDLMVVIALVTCVGYEAYKQKSRESRELLRAMLPLAFFGALELANGFIQFSKAAVLLGIGLIAFVVTEGVYTLRRIKEGMESEKRALRLEAELQQSRVSIMLSQIKPHFLYNTLQGIKLLCDTDPPRASEALEHFSYYLRGNLDAMDSAQLVDFNKELVHIQDYLYLEKMRFGDKLRLEWELLYTDFELPPLTVQPLIENAIRHGLTKKKGSGTLTIRSERVADEVVITVQDNGVGFSPTEGIEDGRSHIGLTNVKNRLAALSGATLLIESEKGVGTIAKILLPQEKVTDDTASMSFSVSSALVDIIK